MADESKLKWTERGKDVELWINNGFLNEPHCVAVIEWLPNGFLPHFKILGKEGWNLFPSVFSDCNSAKAAVVAQLLRRNEVERKELEGLG